MSCLYGSGNTYGIRFDWDSNKNVFEFCEGSKWMDIKPKSMEEFCKEMLKFIKENNLTSN